MTEDKEMEPRTETEIPSHTTKIAAEPGGREVVITQTFDAPRDKVFKIYADPKMIPKWWGPRNLETTVEEMDLRHGGTWKVTQKGPDGNKYGFRGVYHEVVFPERVVRTMEYDGMPGHISLETTTFEEKEGKTVVTTTSVFQNVEDRDGMINSDMERGIKESEERFNELLASEQGESTD